jgi:hypothetical protein
MGAERHAVTADDQHLAELDDLAQLALQPGDLEHIFGGDPVLLAARLEDREHLFRPCVRSRCSDFRVRTGFLQSFLLMVTGAGA